MDNKAMKRLAYIDLVKGIGIICIVIGHSYSFYKGNGSFLMPYLYSFHVPIFFVVSGIIYRQYSNQINIAKKCKALLVPYFIWGSFYQLILLCLSVLGGESVIGQIGSRINNVLQLTSGAMWFLPTMFVTSILFLCSCRIHKVWIRVLLCIIAFTIGAVAPHTLTIVETLWRGLIGFGFMTIGFYGAGLLTEDIKWWLWTLLFVVDTILINVNDTCDLARRSFGVLPLYILISLIGSWLCITGCRYIEEKCSCIFTRIIEKIGRFSIVVLCLHQAFLAILQLMDYKFLGYAIQKTGELEGIIMAMIITTVIYVIIPVLLRYLSWSFGVQKTKSC